GGALTSGPVGTLTGSLTSPTGALGAVGTASPGGAVGTVTTPSGSGTVTAGLSGSSGSTAGGATNLLAPVTNLLGGLLGATAPKK
ncbi:hypothetical protein SB751_31395, partial [Cupriavidus sp. SIMBA_020]